MNKKVLFTSVVLCIIVSANAQASSRMENPYSASSRIELSPLVTNNGTGNTNNIQKSVSNPASKTTPYNYRQTGTKTLNYATSQSDVKIEGRVEKNTNTSLYHNQLSAELQELVQKVGYNIIQANSIKQSVQFVYDESETVNANVNVNNRVRVYKGLIKRCSCEDELAYVIGHELGHATSYHTAKQIGVNYAGNIATRTAVATLSTVVPSGILMSGTSMAISEGVDLSKKKISRICENNADLLSIDFVIKAGYNPLAAIAISYKIGSNYPDFWYDHTSTDRRIVLMYNYIKEKYPRYLEKGYESEAYEHAIKYYVESSNNR